MLGRCKDPSRAGAVLSQHAALQMLGGHPRRIFNAVALLSMPDKTMDDLPDLIRAQIRKEEDEQKIRAERDELELKRLQQLTLGSTDDAVDAESSDSPPSGHAVKEAAAMATPYPDRDRDRDREGYPTRFSAGPSGFGAVGPMGEGQRRVFGPADVPTSPPVMPRGGTPPPIAAGPVPGLAGGAGGAFPVGGVGAGLLPAGTPQLSASVSGLPDQKAALGWFTRVVFSADHNVAQTRLAADFGPNSVIM